MTSLPAPQEASHSHLDWPCEAVLQALEDTDLLTPWLGRRIEAIVAAGTTLTAWQHQHFAQAAHELFLELGSALDRLCLSVLQSDDPHLAQEWFFKLQDKEATFPELASQSLGSSRDSGGRIGPLRQDDLQAQVFAPNKDLAFIRPGQSAEIAFSAYDKSLYGTLPATVSQVSEDALPPSQEYDYPNFPITLELSNQSLTVRDRRFGLQPGMALNAQIKLQQRTVLQLLFSRFNQTLDAVRTMR